MMNPQKTTEFKLALARAWLENGQEDLARNIITKLIDEALASKGEKN